MVELVEPPPGAAATVRARRVRLGDVTRTGRLRLDALARYLQDVAADDVDAVGAPTETARWVLRRLDARVLDAPSFLDDVELTTFCSALGARWAERRTSIRRIGATGPSVEAAALWVAVDDLGRSRAVDGWLGARTHPALRARRVSTRLTHPGPPASATSVPWTPRASDVDVLEHVNNAIVWAALEEVLAARAPDARIAAVGVEHRAPMDPGETVELLTAGGPGERVVWAWMVTALGVRASGRVELA